MPEVDDDQLAALRRLRAAFGPIEIVEVVGHDQVVSNDPEDDRLGDTGQLGELGLVQQHVVILELYCDYCNWRIYPPSDTG